MTALGIDMGFVPGFFNEDTSLLDKIKEAKFKKNQMSNRNARLTLTFQMTPNSFVTNTS